MKDCFNEFRKNMSNAYSSDEINDILDQVNRNINEARDESSDISNYLIEMKHNLFKMEESKEALREFHFYKDLELKNRILRTIGQFAEKNKENAVQRGLLSEISGVQRPVEGARDSFDLFKKVMRGELESGLKNDIKNSGNMPIWNSKEHQLEIAESIQNQGHPEERFDKIGQSIHEKSSMVDELYNRNGVFINKLPGRIIRNFHNPIEMLKTDDNLLQRIKDRKLSLAEQREKAYKRWRDFIKPRLDLEKSFGEFTAKSDKRVNNALQTAFRKLTNNFDMLDRGDLQAMLDLSRVLHLKDPKSVVEYNQKFGVGTIQGAVQAEFDKAANDIATLERFGLHPNRLLEKVIRSIPKVYPELEDTFDKEKVYNMAKGTLDEARGVYNDPYSKAAILGGNIRAAINITKLHKTLFASIPDLANITVRNRRIYGGFFNSLFNSINNMVAGLNMANRREFGDMLKSITMAESGQLVRYAATPDMKTGVMTKLESLGFKLNLMYFWDKANKSGNLIALARHLAKNKDLSYDDIIARDKKFGEENVNILKQYNITPEEWNAIRKVPLKFADGKGYILPESANEIPDEQIKKILYLEGRRRINARDIADKRREIKLKWNGYFIDQADHFVTSPAAREKNLLYAGTSSGTWAGQIMRFIMQYKLFGFTFMRKSFAPLLFGRGEDKFSQALFRGKGDLLGLAQLIGYGSVLAYAGLCATSLLKGESLPDPYDPQIIMQALANANALGAGSDLVLGNHSVVSSLANLAGPAAGDFADFVDIATSGLHGKFATSRAFNYVKNRLGPVNNQFAMMLLNYFMFNRIQEAISPNYFPRKLRELRKHDQHYIIPPVPGFPTQ